jgi:ATP-dependent DNA helicase RecG
MASTETPTSTAFSTIACACTLASPGIRAVCYPGTDPDYATRADEDLKGPMVPLGAADGSIVEAGLVEQASDFVRRNTMPSAHLDSGRRIDRWDYPEGVIREAVVNALVHRDYSIAGRDIMLAIYADRLEIQSPGRLLNTVTPEGMKSGMRYARNQTLVNVMRGLPLRRRSRHGRERQDHPGHARA